VDVKGNNLYCKIKSRLYVHLTGEVINRQQIIRYLKLIELIRYIFLTSLLLTGLLVKSQVPVSDFTSSVTSGCAPLTVIFKDASTGNPKFWNWDLGNGQLANTQNTQAIYYNPGKYTITLVVRNADGTNGITKTDYIVVNPSPTADFIADYNTICMPASIKFTDKSQDKAGTLVKYEWDFGDGTFDNRPNPQKAYTATGYYNISLKVTSSTGCVHSITKGRFVRVLSGVTTAFKEPVTQVCKPPYDLKFVNETSGPGTLTYNWDFGNGNTSTAKDPVFTVTTSAPLNVQLITQSNQGCSDTLKKTVAVNSTLTTFTGSDSACLNAPVAFQNTSQTSLSSSWTFSDGNSSSQLPSVTRTFTSAGSYNVKLVNTYAACTDSLTKTIKILPPPTVDFTSNTPGACKAPQTVNFLDVSPNAVRWAWNFGDGGTSNQKTPSHNYAKEGEYDVSLTITSSAGCTNTLTKSKFIRIAPPVVQISNAPAGGCIPFQFNPVPNIDAVDGVSTYLWDFGDGGATSTLPNPSHTYNTAGNYTIKLSITTIGGCPASVTLTDGIKTGLPSNPEFTANTVQSCADSVIQFNNQSTPAGINYLWNFGDGKTSIIMNPSHQYDSSGSYSVSLTTSNNGCFTTISKPAYITVQPPTARFTYNSDCSTLPTVTFTNTSVIDNTKPVSYLWNFGDPGNGTSTSANPVYRFPAKQTYTVRLTVTNGNCINTYVLPVLLATEKADFRKNTSDTVCRSQNIQISSISSNPQNIKRYQWSADGTPFSTGGNSIVTSIAHTGKIPLSLAVTDLGGCSDTITKFVTIIGSTASFVPSDTAMCANGIITFNDKSSPANSIKQWTFNYGDGSKQTYTNGPFTHQYKNSGSFGVSLSVIGKDGCTDSVGFNNLVRISKPVAAFATNDTLLCPGGSLIFTNFSNIIRPVSYLWNFGDGSATSNNPNPNHTYTGLDSAYTVSLKIQDSLGCTDSLARIKYIKVTSPKSAFTVSDSATICPPLEVKFVPKGKNSKSYYWDFGDNTTSTLDTTNHFYNTYGRYVAKLYVTGAGGCIDSSEHIINVNNPYSSSSVTYSPVTACNSLLVNFNIKIPSNSYYVFNFGDGTNDSSQKDSIKHFYGSPNSYAPYMALRDSSGCEVGIAGATTIRVLGGEPFFSPDRKSFCDSGTVFFTNYTLTNDPIVSSVWDFGDGSTSKDKDAIHTFRQPGQYVVSLNVNTQSGCSKSITDTIRVYRTPVPSISVDSVVCINSPLIFKGLLSAPDSTVSYAWNLGNGTASTQVNPAVTYTKEGVFPVTLEAVNILGCKGTTSKNITVAPLPVITVTPDIVVPVGVGVPVPITYSPRIKSYNWTPIIGLSCIDCAAPVAYPKSTTAYTVNVTDSNGCVTSATFTITVVCNEKNYFVPNTFSPNGDGNNDVFFPRGNNINRVQSMRIFSRWGEMIFEKKNFSANNPADGWNGTYKGKAAPGDVYVYIVEFICENGSIIPFRGNVTLIR